VNKFKLKEKILKIFKKLDISSKKY